MTKAPQPSTQSNPRIYVVHPFPPAPSVLTMPDPLAAARARVAAPVVASAALPPRQPLPRAVIDPAKPMLKLGLDVHLEFIMAVAQKDHANPQAPRKFTNDQLVEQVKRWTAEGLQIFCVAESCGFGFVLHRRLVEAGAQSFLITPIALNRQQER